MRVKRLKRSKRIINFYKKTYSFREPFQLIADGDFVQAGLASKIHLKEQVPQLLMGTAKFMTTPCIMHALKSLGDEYFGAYVASKRYETRNCRHDEKNPKSSADCILDLVGTTNSCRYMVASQNEVLLGILRTIPGVPLVHIYRSVLILDPIPQASAQEKAGIELKKTKVTGSEKKLLEAIIPIDKPKKDASAVARKRAKGPNPLSIKKKARPAVSSLSQPRPPKERPNSSAKQAATDTGQS